MRPALLVTLLGLAGCTSAQSSPTPPATGPETRAYRMGFANTPPSDDFPLAVRSVEMWARRADAAIIHLEPPWTEILANEPLDRIAARQFDGLVGFWRQRDLELVIVVDPSNGVERTSDSDNLRRAGRSMTEPAIQQRYRDWVRTLVTRYRPVAIGLAVETNLIRDAAPPALYQAIVRAANDAARDIRAIDATLPCFITVQVEHAWGRLMPGDRYRGIAQDFRDFPFTAWVGLSSYPYLAGFTEPAEVPDDWYTRPLAGRTLPTLVTEGGWSSASAGTIRGTPARQAAWMRRHAQLLDRLAPRYLFQLTFSDLTTRVFGNDPRLTPFLRLGLVDTTLAPKPALAVWDSLFARRRGR